MRAGAEPPRPGPPAAGLVLAGGRSTRMGSSKAALPWASATLLAHVAGVVRGAVEGPVVVVRAPGQRLPSLPAGVDVCEDPQEGVGPLLGLCTGLQALAGRADVAFACATDMAHLAPAFVRRVLHGFAQRDDAEVVMPVVGGIAQPLAAGYRTSLVDRARGLLAGGARALTALGAASQVLRLDEEALLASPELRDADPQLRSVCGLNTRADYDAARALARPGPVAVAAGPDRPEQRRAPA